MRDMSFILIPEITNGGQYRIGGSLSQAAQGAFLDLEGKVLQPFDITLFSFAFGDAGEYFEHSFGSDAAEGTFPAGFFTGEVEKEPGHVDHTGGFVHDDHSAGTHDGTGFGDFGVIDLGP